MASGYALMSLGDRSFKVWSTDKTLLSAIAASANELKHGSARILKSNIDNDDFMVGVSCESTINTEILIYAAKLIMRNGWVPFRDTGSSLSFRK